MRCQPADVADGLPAEFFDTVILNSVVQYFPDAGYLFDGYWTSPWTGCRPAGGSSSATSGTTAP